jgi:hypothetical protein
MFLAVPREAEGHGSPGDEVPQAAHSVKHPARGTHVAALGVHSEKGVGDNGVRIEEFGAEETAV